MAKPSLLDNRSAATRHEAALEQLFREVTAPDDPAAIATGYVNLAGLNCLAMLADGRTTRLMLGALPDPGLGEQIPIDRFALQLVALGEERDFSRFPPSRWSKRLQAVDEWLDRPEIEVRRYTQQFLHGKAYLFGTADDPEAALVTSANLTGAGLSRNLELGVTDYNPPVTGPAIEWFNALWADAVEFKEELRDLLFPGIDIVDPETVYLRALLELQQPEIEDADRPTRPQLELAPFQRDGYERARVIAKRHGGVIYADGVGTGKTEIGLAFIEERTQEDGVYALVVCPAQLKARWQERIEAAKLSARAISFQELATDEQLAPDVAAPRRHLPLRKDSYRLVVVDEAHALRNEDTTWYRAMERLLGGVRKQVVLLSATPINNGLWDLYNLVMLFGRHDRAFVSAGIDSVRNLFFEAGANGRDPEDLRPDVLFPLADAVSVRRDRAFIEEHYSGATFPNGTPVRFPRPLTSTRRYDLDADHTGLFEDIVAAIEQLTMARYRPSAYELDATETAVDAQLGGLVKSGVLKRFESCWKACLITVKKMLAAHEAFLAAWATGQVLSRDALASAGGADIGAGGLAGWVEEQLQGEQASRSVDEFSPEFVEHVRADRDLLSRIHDRLATLSATGDPKLALLSELLESSSAQKIAVFATYGDTVRYLDEHLPQIVGGRKRIAVIGNETSPDERAGMLGRFAPKTVVRPDYEPPEGEVDLLVSTDVLSEGQNLQQAQAVISYDMPWNPQRVVQRNGRVIRLLSEHEEVYLATMLPERGELDRMLGLEAKIQAKVRAASGVYGMESEVVEGQIEDELRAFAERLVDGDEELLKEAEEDSGAFVGEELRRLIDRAAKEGELARIEALPWGIGACFKMTPAGRSTGPPGVFFAARTRTMADAERGFRYWRYVELDGGEVVANDLALLRRIEPEGGSPAHPNGVDLEAAWEVAAADIVREHNDRTDLRDAQENIGPKQRWALSILRDPSVTLPPGGADAEEALRVERSSAVRRALGDIQASRDSGEISPDQAAAAIADLVRDFGLQPVEPPPLPDKIAPEDLGVVCWMAVLPAEQ
jgi:superfamily II DNA or RNA helicase